MKDLLNVVRTTPEYKAILEHLKYRCDTLSGITHINHIDEGIQILEVICAPRYLYNAAKAFCLHPMVSHDLSLVNNIVEVCSSGFDTTAILYAMEFRKTIASWPNHRTEGEPSISPLIAINKMITADIIQHKSHFLRYSGVPEGSDPSTNSELRFYNDWLRTLAIDEEAFYTIIKDSGI